MRKLVAALACRNGGSRMYGKPLQNLDVSTNLTVLDHILSVLSRLPEIDEVVLGISEGDANLDYVEFAKKRGIKFIVGDERDVLSRLIACGKAAGATDIFRVTTESPFLYFEPVASTWKAHVAEDLDASLMDHVPDGCGFEILKLSALEESHKSGTSKHRSELCTLYIRENPTKFKVRFLTPDKKFDRKDIRLTIDNPEDLIVCRAVYGHFKSQAPLIPVGEIIAYLDTRPELLKLTLQYCDVGYSTMYVKGQQPGNLN